MQDVLFLAQRIPYPPNKGDKIRSFHALRELTRHARIHLGCFIDDPVDWEHVPKLREMVASLCVRPLSRRRATLRSTRAFLSDAPLSVPFYRDGHLQDWVTANLARVRPAAAYLFSSPMAQYVMRSGRPPRVVMDFVDVDSQKWADYSGGRGWPMGQVYRREGRTLLDFERRVAQFADASVFVSAAERDLFRKLAPETAGRLHAVNNGTDADYFSPDRDYPAPFDMQFPTLVFAGAMDYWPNIEAATWFARSVMPKLRQVQAETRFYIVGINPTPDVLALGTLTGVTVTGRVPDMRPYLAHARAIVAPLLTARGVQNKVLEGMAMARPVIATSQAFEGIEAVPGQHLHVADGADSFADASLKAMIDPASVAMGVAARVQIRRVYGWEPQLARLKQLVLEDTRLKAA